MRIVIPETGDIIKKKVSGKNREIIDIENYMQTTGITQTVIQEEIRESAVKHGVFRVLSFGSRTRGNFREKTILILL